MVRPGDTVRLFLCGDLMLGRGIDQALPSSCEPQLFESYVKDARHYVALAEAVNGPIKQPVAVDYPWGDALSVLDNYAPHLRLANLETSITSGGEPWPEKGIHYRMHPDNVSCLQTARMDCCSLANNHVLDWGYTGMKDTLNTLTEAGVTFAGAGLNRAKAQRPAVLEAGQGRRVIVLACGLTSSGIPDTWAAKETRPGVYLLPSLTALAIKDVVGCLDEVRRPGDVVVCSIHWGANWVYRLPSEQRDFARALIDRAGVDVIHGHSSHHPLAAEVYRGRLILYGCGDFINDYEGIPGYEAFRNDLTLMYFADLDTESGALQDLQMVPMQLHRLSLRHASADDAGALVRGLEPMAEGLGTQYEYISDNSLRLVW